MVWIIRELKQVEKIRKRLGSSQLSLYLNLIRDFKTCDDPRDLGELKKIDNRWYLVTKLNKSFRVKYLVDYSQKFIIIVEIGDHKDVYGKD